MDLVLVEMNQVLSQMLELETFNEAIAMLRGIMESQEKIHEKTKKQRRSCVAEGLAVTRRRPAWRDEHDSHSTMLDPRRRAGDVLLLAAGQCARRPSPPNPQRPPVRRSWLDEQSTIAEQYRRFEAVLLRMAELTAATDPRRAALLRQAVEQSKNRAINDRFDSIVKFLQEKLAWRLLPSPTRRTCRRSSPA